MKNVLSIMAISLLMSCSNKAEEPIRKYVQNFEGTQINLNVDFLNIEKLNPYTSKQLGTNVKRQIDLEVEKFALDAENDIKENRIEISIRKIKMIGTKNKELLDSYKRSIKLYEYSIALDSSSIEQIEEKNYKRLSKKIDSLLSLQDRLLVKPDSVVAIKRKVKYKIINPLLNNAEQTLTKIFYLEPDYSKVIRSEDIE